MYNFDISTDIIQHDLADSVLVIGDSRKGVPQKSIAKTLRRGHHTLGVSVCNVFEHGEKIMIQGSLKYELLEILHNHRRHFVPCKDY